MGFHKARILFVSEYKGKVMFEVGKVYKTADNTDIMVVCNNAPGKFPVIGYIVDPNDTSHFRAPRWTLEGKYATPFNEDCYTGHFDLIPKRTKLYIATRYVGYQMDNYRVFPSRSEAEAYLRSWGLDRTITEIELKLPGEK